MYEDKVLKSLEDLKVMVCSELVGVAGNFPRIIRINPLEYRCMGESYKDENCAIRKYIIAYGWATHIWSEIAGNSNPNLLRDLGQRCGVIIQTAYGELIQFERSLILWVVCNSTIRGLQQQRCDVKISNAKCPICKCNDDNCCKQNCMWWVAFRLSVIKEVLIPSNKSVEILKAKVKESKVGRKVRGQPNNLLDLWLDRYRWLEDAYSSFYYICDLKNKLQQKSVVFLKIIDAEDVSCIKLNRNDFEYYDPNTGNYIQANSFFKNRKQMFRTWRGELIQVRRINNKGDEYVKKMSLYNMDL